MKTANTNYKMQALVGVLAATWVMLTASASQAYVLNGNKWPGSHPRIPYYVSTSLQGAVPYDGTFEQGVSAIQNAANTWNTQGGAESKFTYAGLTEVNEVADDGINAIIFSNTQCPYGNYCTAGAFYHQTNGVFRGFDIVLYGIKATSGSQTYWSAKNMPYPYEEDLWSIVLHEFGHGLGLGHSTYAVVMGTSCGTGCVSRNLYSDDKNGVKAIYGAYTNEGIVASATQVQAGSSFTLSLSYPKAKRAPYAIFMSVSGMEGFPLYNLTQQDSRILGINGDFFPTENYPGIFVNFEGRLNGQGQATATVNVPADINFLGQDLYFSVVTIDGQYLNGYEDVGVGVHVRVNP